MFFSSSIFIRRRKKEERKEERKKMSLFPFSMTPSHNVPDFTQISTVLTSERDDPVVGEPVILEKVSNKCPSESFTLLQRGGVDVLPCPQIYSMKRLDLPGPWFEPCKIPIPSSSTAAVFPCKDNHYGVFRDPHTTLSASFTGLGSNRELSGTRISSNCAASYIDFRNPRPYPFPVGWTDFPFEGKKSRTAPKKKNLILKVSTNPKGVQNKILSETLSLDVATTPGFELNKSFWKCFNSNGQDAFFSSIKYFQVVFDSTKVLTITLTPTMQPKQAAKEGYQVFTAGGSFTGFIPWGKGFTVKLNGDYRHLTILPRTKNGGFHPDAAYPVLLGREPSSSSFDIKINKSISWSSISGSDSGNKKTAAQANTAWANIDVSFASGYSSLFTRPQWVVSAGQLWYRGPFAQLPYTAKTTLKIFLTTGVRIGVPLTQTSLGTTVDFFNAIGATLASALNGLTSTGDLSNGDINSLQAISYTIPGGGFYTIDAGDFAGNISLTGYGKITGNRLLKDFGRKNPSFVFSGTHSAYELLQAIEYYVVSELIGFAVPAGQPSPGIVVKNVIVQSPSKRNKSSVQLNGYNTFSAGRPSVTCSDFKLLGSWVDGSDGCETLADNSSFDHIYYHINDDSCKMGANNISFDYCICLQGNAGGIINVGNYGAILGDAENSSAQNIGVHRITQVNPGQDGEGGSLQSMINTRNGSDKAISATISKVYVPNLGQKANKGPNCYTNPFGIGFQQNSFANTGPGNGSLTVSLSNFIGGTKAFSPSVGTGYPKGLLYSYGKDSSTGQNTFVGPQEWTGIHPNTLTVALTHDSSWSSGPENKPNPPSDGFIIS